MRFTISPFRECGKGLAALILCIAVTCLPTPGLATNVRGKVNYSTAKGAPYPAHSVKVFLEREVAGQWKAVGSPVYTGHDGMYYLFSVPAGTYRLTMIAPNGKRGSKSVTVPDLGNAPSTFHSIAAFTFP